MRLIKAPKKVKSSLVVYHGGGSQSVMGKRDSKYCDPVEEQAYEAAAKLPKLTPQVVRQAELARRASASLNRSLMQLEAAINRSSEVEVKVCAFPLMGSAHWAAICRAIATACFHEAKYWEFHVERLVGVDQATKDRMQRVYLEYSQFAGSGE